MTMHAHLYRFREKPFVSALPKLKIYPLSEENRLSNLYNALSSNSDSSVSSLSLTSLEIVGLKM